MQPSFRILLQTGDVGEGVIDNIIIDRSVHLTAGVIVLVTLTLATALVIRHAVRGEQISPSTRASLAIAQVALIAQVLLGIKLLDQGQGIVQLYIHYVGGLIPLGAFLLAGWMARGDSPRSAKVLAALILIGEISALMAFFIGRAYVN